MNENPEMSITEVAKELGRRRATLEPSLKASYENRYQDARKVYDSEMSHFKPQKKKKDPNAPKQPLSAYFIFSTEERLRVKEGNPGFSICEVAKELGRRWAEMDPALNSVTRHVLRKNVRNTTWTWPVIGKAPSHMRTEQLHLQAVLVVGEVVKPARSHLRSNSNSSSNNNNSNNNSSNSNNSRCLRCGGRQ